MQKSATSVAPTRLVAVATAVLALVAAACGGGPGPGTEEATAPIADQIFALRASASYADTPYSSPSETTPLTSFVVDGHAVGSASDLFVAGTVRSVTGSKGYSWTGPQIEGGPSTESVHEFNSTAAQISTIHLVVEIDRTLFTDQGYADRREVTVGLALLSPVSLDALRKEMVGQGIAAPLLSNEKTFFILEPGVFGVLGDGEFLGFVDELDNVTFPVSDLELKSTDGATDAASTIELADLFDDLPPVVNLRTVDGTLEVVS